MIRFSTGLRDAVTYIYGFAQVMNAGVIYVYSGTIPDSPDDPPNGILLGMVTTSGLPYTPGNDANGAGLLLRMISPGGIVPASGAIWRLVGSASGEAGWFRWCASGPDAFNHSTTRARMDGTVGDVLILEEPIISVLTNIQVDSFLFVMGKDG